jgi:hypothetical protein
VLSAEAAVGRWSRLASRSSAPQALQETLCGASEGHGRSGVVVGCPLVSEVVRGCLQAANRSDAQQQFRVRSPLTAEGVARMQRSAERVGVQSCQKC